MIIKNLQDIPSFMAGDLTQIKEVLHPKNEDIDLNYSLAHATVGVGESSLPHTLKDSTEVYFILSGIGTAFIADRVIDVKVGSVLLIPKGEIQWIKNTGRTPLNFLCIVSPPWTEQQEDVA